MGSNPISRSNTPSDTRTRAGAGARDVTREAGFVLIVVGAVVAGALGWFGNLPGDLRFDRGSVRVYAPLASMLVVSIVLTLLLALLRRLF